MSLSIVIPCLNDHAQINPTIASLRETTPEQDVEIIVIDDHSDIPVQVSDTRARLIRMDRRVGGGVARHIGALHARHPFVFFTDSHMRFRPGWYQKAMDRIVDRPDTVHVAKCLGLAEDRMELDQAQGAYLGARLNYIGSDPGNPSRLSIMEGVWGGPTHDDADVECMMGACYFWPKELFFRIGGKNLLRDWGSEETFTSIKLWMTGHRIKLMPHVEVGHMFRSKNGYPAPLTSVVYNKLMVAKVCFPEPAYQAIEGALVKAHGGDSRLVDTAKHLLEGDSRLVQIEQHRLASMLKMPLPSLLCRFGREVFW